MIKGFVCLKTEQEVLFEDCLKCALKEAPCGWDYAILSQIVKQLTEERKVFSVTNLLTCPRKIYWQLVEDQFILLSDAYYFYRGNIFHSIAEQAVKDREGILIEPEWKKEINGFELWGHPDIVYLENQIIKDFKTTIKVPKFGLIYPHHGIQVNLYRLIAPLEIKRLFIVYLDMARIQQVEIPLLDEERLKGWVLERLNLLNAHLEARELPPPTKSIWQCNYCSFFLRCHPQTEEILIPIKIRAEELPHYLELLIENPLI